MAIDIHTHVVPFELPACPAGASAARWPGMQAGPDRSHRNVVIAGKVFRTVSDACWDISRRLGAMDATGITTQVLSPMPERLSYWIETNDALVYPSPERALGQMQSPWIHTLSAFRPG